MLSKAFWGIVIVLFLSIGAFVAVHEFAANAQNHAFKALNVFRNATHSTHLHGQFIISDELKRSSRAAVIAREITFYVILCFSVALYVLLMVTFMKWMCNKQRKGEENTKEKEDDKDFDSIASRPLPPPPSHLKRVMSIAASGSSTVDRARGVFWGQLVGDALGSSYEFMDAPETSVLVERHLDAHGHLPMRGGGPFGLQNGQVTDDSEMALSMAGTMIREGTYSQNSVACAYCRWRMTNPPDIGTTTLKALVHDVRITQNWWITMSAEDVRDVAGMVRYNVENCNASSLSNGCLMRISPIAVAFWSSPRKMLRYGEEDVELTHVHESSFDAVRVYLAAMAALIRGASPNDAYEEAVGVVQTNLIHQHLKDAKKYAVPVRLENGSQTYGDTRSIGYVGVALQSAFHEMLSARSFRQGLINSIARGGDTDTNAAITGALLGARFGESAIPADWITDVREARLRLKGENSIENVDKILEDLLILNERDPNKEEDEENVAD